MGDQLEGRNAVLEALKNEREISEIFLAENTRGKTIEEIKNLASRSGISVTLKPKTMLDQIAQSHNHQGVLAKVGSYRYANLEQELQRVSAESSCPLFLLLDGIEDPHNLGSMIRSAEVFGVSGVIIPKHRAAGITPAVAKTASGALEHVPVMQVTNINDAIKRLKARNFWIAGGDGDSRQDIDHADLSGPLGLVIGSEGKGLSRLVRKNCDYLVRIPMSGKTGSLNASVAAGVLLYEVQRQNLRKKETAR